MNFSRVHFTVIHPEPYYESNVFGHLVLNEKIPFDDNVFLFFFYSLPHFTQGTYYI